MTKSLIDELKDARKAIDSALEKLEGTKKEPEQLKELKSIVNLSFNQTCNFSKRIMFDVINGDHELRNGVIIFPERMKHSIKVFLDYRLIHRETELTIQLFDEDTNQYISDPYCVNPHEVYKKLLEGFVIRRTSDHLVYNFLTSDNPRRLTVRILNGKDNLLEIHHSSTVLLESTSII